MRYQFSIMNYYGHFIKDYDFAVHNTIFRSVFHSSGFPSSYRFPELSVECQSPERYDGIAPLREQRPGELLLMPDGYRFL